jgi:hypothetical protein
MDVNIDLHGMSILSGFFSQYWPEPHLLAGLDRTVADRKYTTRGPLLGAKFSLLVQISSCKKQGDSRLGDNRLHVRWYRSLIYSNEAGNTSFESFNAIHPSPRFG